MPGLSIKGLTINAHKVIASILKWHDTKEIGDLYAAQDALKILIDVEEQRIDRENPHA